MASYGGGDTDQEETTVNQNPITQVGLNATLEDNFFFVDNPEEQYVGLYHIHQDGEIMIGAGELGITHDMTPSEIIFQKVTYVVIQETREVVSDLFYKLWFEENTLTDEQVLSMQTTIRDGIKQSGRTEDEPLVFYKKDRNTLENRKDIQGDVFEQICQYLFDNNIIDLENMFSIIQTDLPAEGTPPQPVTQYKIKFTDGTTSYEVNVARKVGDIFTDILNLSQLTKTKTSSKIDPVKASDILDTDIFELLPAQPNRQEQINNLFSDFDELVGPTPVFTDVDGDGAGEQPDNYQEDEESRVSHENQVDAFITRLDEQANEDNGDKTLESMRNKLNTYLGDVDNVIQDLPDTRPEYENISNGFLKIRKPNQAIIIKGQSNNELEFQKNNSYLTDGFTITMWVRFVSKTSEGTLFNFGNPNEVGGKGFRLETNVTQDGNDKYRRTIRLVVKDDLIRDNHYGYKLSNGNVGLNRITGRDLVSRGNSNFNPTRRFPTKAHNIYPAISTDDLNEWYFICATYNPQVVEDIEESELSSNTQYWLNHIDGNGEVVANSNLGAKCKVEIISKSDLLRARGYKISDLTIDTDSEDGEILEDNEIDIPPVDDINEEEEDSNIEPNPMLAPNGFNPMTNPMTGTLSPQGQWIWNGVSMTWLPVEIEEEEETEEEDSNVEQMPTNPPVGFNPMTNNFMQGTLSPQGQWRWTGQGMTWAAVDSGGY
jgi:hypothetical protein